MNECIRDTLWCYVSVLWLGDFVCGWDLESKLREAAGCRMRLIASDGVFSMDGNVAPLQLVYCLLLSATVLQLVLRRYQTIDKVGRLCLPIKSASKYLSSVMQKLADFVHHRTRSSLNDKIGQLFGYRSTDFVYVFMVIFTVGDEYLF